MSHVSAVLTRKIHVSDKVKH